MFSNFPLGTIIVFRYAPKDRRVVVQTRTVMVLAQNFQGNLHCLNLRYMYPQEQEAVQWYFKSIIQKRFQTDPMEKLKAEFDQQMEEYQNRKAEYLKKQTGVVVTPAARPPVGPAGARPSPFKTSTWNGTPKQITPATQFNRGAQQPPAPPPAPPQQSILGNIRQQIGQATGFTPKVMAPVPTDPYQFYHRIVKPIFGRSASRFYRKYKVTDVYNARVLKKV